MKRHVHVEFHTDKNKSASPKEKMQNNTKGKSPAPTREIPAIKIILIQMAKSLNTCKFEKRKKKEKNELYTRVQSERITVLLYFDIKSLSSL